jgi:hypothetical protein
MSTHGVKVPGSCPNGSASSALCRYLRILPVPDSLYDLHLRAVVAVEAVAFHDGGLQAFTTKDLLERLLDGRRSRARRPGDGDDGMLR